jgi:predicted permease
VWTPQIVDPRFAPRLRSWRYDRVVARLAPDAAISEAQAQLEVIARQLERETPAASAGWTATVEPLHDSIVGAFGRAAWLMFAAVAVVLLVSCLNVAGLLVARAVARDRETAVRLSLGASRARLLRLWLSESTLIAGAGAVLGVLLAHAAVAALVAMAPDAIPRLDAIAVDRNALALAVAATVIATASFALAPLMRTLRGEVAHPLRTRSDTAGGRGGQLLRTGLTAAQCGGAAALVVLAMMFTRSFVNLVSHDLGWRADDIVSVQASPRIPAEMRRPWFARAEWALGLIATLQATRGIEGAAVTTQLPFGPAPFQSALARGRGRTAADDVRWSAIEHRVTPGYFDLMEIPQLAGRAFTPQDRFTEAEMNDSSKRPPRGVAIVSAHTARTLWPGESPIGRAIWLPDSDNVAWREVIGVVGDLQFGAIGQQPGLHVFVPWLQNSASARVYVFVKGSGERDVTSALARELVSGTAPGAIVDDMTSLDSLTARATAQPRFTSRVVLLFAALALALSAVGIYGTLSCIVSSRVKEIGIRLALGARRRDIFGSVLMRGMLPAVGGTAVGVVVGLVIANTFRALLFDIGAVDPIAVGTAAVILAIVGCATAAVPAHRASRLDPVDTLRVE